MRRITESTKKIITVELPDSGQSYEVGFDDVKGARRTDNHIEIHEATIKRLQQHVAQLQAERLVSAVVGPLGDTKFAADCFDDALGVGDD